jgi:nucleoside-diphosphate-sugar epimerase
MDILVTGATGFVGRALINVLLKSGHQITAPVRMKTKTLPSCIKQIEIGDLSSLYSGDDCHSGLAEIENQILSPVSSDNQELNLSLRNADVVVHMAARVHVMSERATDPLNAFRCVNTYPTLSLARQAAHSGVKRFIFISTVKVNGEFTDIEKPFSENDECHPNDPYAISKREAECGLVDLAKETGMEVVIIRPPLVYGPGVKGNFARMLSWVSKGLPLPLGRIKNKRSMLALDNLISFIICCLVHREAADQTFLISDGEDISTTELIQKLARAQGIKARLVPIPVSWMRFIAGILRRKASAERLFNSLLVDNYKARTLLGWSPVVSMEQQLQQMINLPQSEQRKEL